jgi:hypothetical protein
LNLPKAEENYQCVHSFAIEFGKFLHKYQTTAEIEKFPFEKQQGPVRQLKKQNYSANPGNLSANRKQEGLQLSKRVL